MATEIEIDEDNTVNTSCLTPPLKTSPFIEKGRKLRIICFSGAPSKNAKRANLQKIHNIESYKERAFKWTSLEHAYNKAHEAINWEKKNEFYTHKSCKGLFCKDSFMMSQTEKTRCTNEVLDFDDTNSDTQSVQSAKYYPEYQVQLRRSTRQQFTYQSFQEESKCIICTEVKKDNHGKVIPVQTMTFRSKDDKEHLAEKQLKEFAQIHVENCTKFQDVGNRIQLNSSINSSLFSANVRYHKSFYQIFRAPSGKKVNSDKPFTFEKDCMEELVGVIEYLVVLKRKVYTLHQLRELYATIKKVDINTIQSIDIKRVIEERLSGKVQFCRPTCESRSRGIQSEHVLSADENILSDVINAILTGEGITNYMKV